MALSVAAGHQTAHPAAPARGNGPESGQGAGSVAAFYDSAGIVCSVCWAWRSALDLVEGPSPARRLVGSLWPPVPRRKVPTVALPIISSRSVGGVWHPRGRARRPASRRRPLPCAQPAAASGRRRRSSPKKRRWRSDQASKEGRPEGRHLNLRADRESEGLLSWRKRSRGLKMLRNFADNEACAERFARHRVPRPSPELMRSTLTTA